MKETRLLMDMPITIEIVDSNVDEAFFSSLYRYFESIDHRFSIFRTDSEISRLNNGAITLEEASQEMQEIFRLAEKTKQETNGFFEIKRNGTFDPSGIVKGYAIWQVSRLIDRAHFNDYYVDAGGDIQVGGKNTQGEKWKIGIRNPFNRNQNIKTVRLQTEGIATSGTSIRGQHIQNPFLPDKPITDIVSLTVIGPNIYEADRFATAAFAMGKNGIHFIEQRQGLEGYIIDAKGVATWTMGFEQFVDTK